MALKIFTYAAEPASLTLALEGSLDAVTSPELESFLTENLKDEITTLILDLERLTFVSSAGLRTFARTRKALMGRGGKLCFVHLSPQVQKVFDIVKAVPHADVFRNTAELDEYLAMMQRRVAQGA